MSRLYNITAFPNILNPNQQIKKAYSWTNLCRFLGADRKPVDKLKQGSWAPATFNGRRCAENVVSLSCMVLDIDHKHTMYGVGATMMLKRYKCYMHSSISHNRRIEDRFRLVFPLDRDAAGEDWMYYHLAMRTWWQQIFHDQEFDTSASDASRIYFVGYRTEHWEDFQQDGKMIDWHNRAIDEKKKFIAEQKRLEAERAKRIEEIKRREAALGKNRSYSDMRKYKYEQLAEDPTERLRFAKFLGCTIKDGVAGDRAIGWTCPQCHKNDCTFFFVDPIRKDNNQSSSLAYCMHRKSCNFRKSLGYLAELNGYL